MTIEGRPNLIPDPLFEKELMKSYDEQRKSRLSDVISDYLNDEDKTALDFYNDLVEELDVWLSYYQKFTEKYKYAKMLVNGHRKVSSDPQFLTEETTTKRWWDECEMK